MNQRQKDPAVNTYSPENVTQFHSPFDGFLDAMFQAGLISEVRIVPDGEIHRFKA